MNFLPINFVPKGWGWESWIVNKKEYCGKLLFFKRSKFCSFHYHKLKDETFYLQDGKLEVVWSHDDQFPDEDELRGGSPDRGLTILEPGDCFYVPPGLRHQMRGIEDSLMIEFSTEHFEEDSYRVVKGD